jgi:hypothetical protein
MGEVNPSDRRANGKFRRHNKAPQKRDVPSDAVLNVRVPGVYLDRWKVIAAAEGGSLADWVIGSLVAAESRNIPPT